ncbi:MAG: YdaU family protein [Prevotellaceae bacterium]|nr:YdaU family protein [Prevotellaceae bacterium]
MTKDPAVLFYTSDFLAETILMSDEEVGQYIKLLCLQHQKGVLSEKDMKKICFSQSEDIFNKFVKNADGHYYNEKWAEEINRRKNFCQSRRNNRITKQIKSNHPASGEGDMSDICSTHVEHMGTEAEAITGTKIETGGKGGTGEKPPANGFLPENVVALYHEHCPSFPHLARLTDARKTKIKIRLAEVGSMEKLGELFRKMEASRFLKGDNPRGWKATFDWLFENEKNWVKVIEGNYDNEQPADRPPASAGVSAKASYDGTF